MKAKRAKPARCWAIVGEDGYLYFATCRRTRKELRSDHPNLSWTEHRIARVEIREIPKRPTRRKGR